MKRTRTFVAALVSGCFMAAVLAAPTFAQTGNLLANGRFDLADGVNGWQVVSPQFSSLGFDPALDADACSGSGSAWATADSTVDDGTASYRVCLGAATAGQPYWISGEFLFLTSAVAGRASLALSFLSGPNCTGDYAGDGLFAGYAWATETGWQQFAAGPIVPVVTAQSMMVEVMLTQSVGADPAIVARFDNIRVTLSDGIFADDFEIGHSCRWDVTLP